MKHPDIGKKVKWYYGSKSGTGILRAVDCDTSSTPHIVQRDDGKGWELEMSDGSSWYESVCAQGVKNGEKNLNWVERYEVIEEDKTLKIINTPFPPNKTIKELGIDPSRKFIVVVDEYYEFKKDDILILETDDDSVCPFFKRLSDGRIVWCNLSRLAYAEEHEVKVGDRFLVVHLTFEVDSLHNGGFMAVRLIPWEGNKNNLIKQANHGVLFSLEEAHLLHWLPRTKRKVTQAQVNERFGEEVEVVEE